MSLNGLAAEINLLDPDLPVSVAVADLDGLPRGALVAHSRGDEFAVALPDASCEEALLALEAVRASFAGSEPAPGLTAPLGVSVGIAGRPAHGSTAEELLEAADAGLVRAKRAGGNRIAIHVEERMILKSSYYPRPSLHRLTKLARRTGRPEASLLREALDDYLARHQELL